jgi:N-acetyl-D-muramate 6-phosphate phosphatase
MTVACKAVLFDLDGTLIDSAPDLAGAANDLRSARGLAPLPFGQLRPMVGSGARGMVGRAFGVVPGDALFESLRDEFLARYEERLAQETRVFDAVGAVLERLQAHGLPWGIVTNKATRFSEPLVVAMGLRVGAATLVSGDTTAPLLEAARRMGVAATDCIYVGDDLRDVQAGRAAGMATVAAAWGYLGDGEAIEAWRADHVIQTPHELLTLLGLA